MKNSNKTKKSTSKEFQKGFEAGIRFARDNNIGTVTCPFAAILPHTVSPGSPSEPYRVPYDPWINPQWIGTGTPHNPINPIITCTGDAIRD